MYINKKIGNVYYQTSLQDGSTKVSISENNSKYTPEYQVFILADQTEFVEKGTSDLILTIKMTDDFKDQMEIRYKKYNNYLNKYNSYINASKKNDNYIEYKNLFADEIEKMVTAYETLISLVKLTYSGSFDDENKDDYNKPIANYIQKYQNKIDVLKEKFYDDTKTVVDISKINKNDVDQYVKTVLKKYESLDQIHLVPLIDIPSKSTISNTYHKFGKKANKTGKWRAKWADGQKKYYKHGRPYKNVHSHKVLVGNELENNKQIISLSAFDPLNLVTNSWLELLATAKTNYVNITISYDKLNAIYDELITKENNTNISGRYWFRKFKRFINVLAKRKHNKGLSYFKFKYFLVDFNTNRKYKCYSSKLKYSFSHTVKNIDDLLIETYSPKNEYYEREKLNTAGLIVKGRNNTTSETSDVTSHCKFSVNGSTTIPWLKDTDPSTGNNMTVYIKYYNDTNYVSTTYNISVSKLIPKEILVCSNSPLLFDGLKFDIHNYGSIIAYYEYTDIIINVTDMYNVTYTPVKDPMIYSESKLDLCKVEYTHNNKTVDVMIRDTVLPFYLTDIIIESEPELKIFALSHNFSETGDEWKDMTFKLKLEIDDGVGSKSYQTMVIGYNQYDGNYPGFTCEPDLYNKNIKFIFHYKNTGDENWITKEINYQIELAKISSVKIVEYKSWNTKFIWYKNERYGYDGKTLYYIDMIDDISLSNDLKSLKINVEYDNGETYEGWYNDNFFKHIVNSRQVLINSNTIYTDESILLIEIIERTNPFLFVQPILDDEDCLPNMIDEYYLGDYFGNSTYTLISKSPDTCNLVTTYDLLIGNNPVVVPDSSIDPIISYNTDHYETFDPEYDTGAYWEIGDKYIRNTNIDLYVKFYDENKKTCIATWAARKRNLFQFYSWMYVNVRYIWFQIINNDTGQIIESSYYDFVVHAHG